MGNRSCTSGQTRSCRKFGRQNTLYFSSTSWYYEKRATFYSILPNIEQQLELAKKSTKQKMVKEEVTENDIASIVSRWTGIPVDKMMAEERETPVYGECIKPTCDRTKGDKSSCRLHP